MVTHKVKVVNFKIFMGPRFLLGSLFQMTNIVKMRKNMFNVSHYKISNKMEVKIL